MLTSRLTASASDQVSLGRQSGLVSRRAMLTGGLGLTVAGVAALAGPRVYRRVPVRIWASALPCRQSRFRSAR